MTVQSDRVSILRCSIQFVPEIVILIKACFISNFLLTFLKEVVVCPMSRFSPVIPRKPRSTTTPSSYGVSLEVECEINNNTSTREIEEASSKLFALCRRIVAGQKGVNLDTVLNSASVPAKAPIQPAPVNPAPAKLVAMNPAPAVPAEANGNGVPKPASPKQIKYLLDTAKRIGLSKADIQNLPATFNKPSFESLSSVEASKLIESLARKKAA